MSTGILIGTAAVGVGLIYLGSRGNVSQTASSGATAATGANPETSTPAGAAGAAASNDVVTCQSLGGAPTEGVSSNNEQVLPITSTDVNNTLVVDPQGSTGGTDPSTQASVADPSPYDGFAKWEGPGTILNTGEAIMAAAYGPSKGEGTTRQQMSATYTTWGSTLGEVW